MIQYVNFRINDQVCCYFVMILQFDYYRINTCVSSVGTTFLINYLSSVDNRGTRVSAVRVQVFAIYKCWQQHDRKRLFL